MPLPRARSIVCIVSSGNQLVHEDAEPSRGKALVDRARAAAAAGVDLFQIRERGLTDSALCQLTREIVAVSAGSGMQVLVNDRLDVAVASGAHGVQLREDSIGPADARRLVPQGFLLGRSVHEAAGDPGPVDFVLFGTVYASPSKPAGHMAAGPSALAKAVRCYRVPVLAIGGVNATNLRQVAATGAAGIAAIAWLCETDPGALSGKVSAVRAAFDTPDTLI